MHEAELWFGGPLWVRFPYGAIFNRLRVSKTFEISPLPWSLPHLAVICSFICATLASVIMYALVHQPEIKELAKPRVRNSKDCCLNSTYCSHKSFYPLLMRNTWPRGGKAQLTQFDFIMPAMQL